MRRVYFPQKNVIINTKRLWTRTLIQLCKWSKIKRAMLITSINLHQNDSFAAVLIRSFSLKKVIKIILFRKIDRAQLVLTSTGTVS